MGLTDHQNWPELVYKRVGGWEHVGVGPTPGCPYQQIKRPRAAYEEREPQLILNICAPLGTFQLQHQSWYLRFEWFHYWIWGWCVTHRGSKRQLSPTERVHSR